MTNVAEFNTLTIEDATERLIDYRGKTPPKTDSGIRLVTAKVVKGGQIHDEPAEYIAADFYDEWMRRGLPQKLDVLLTTEAPLGEVAILRDDVRIALAQRIILLRAKPGLLDSIYFFYALQSDFCQSELKARASGTTVLGIKQSELRKVRVPVFPLPVQQRIAGVLSAYDELIENSQRRIKILESMASALYREWFVHFRFPGHENHPRVASSLGEIPQGWGVEKLSAVADINRAQINARSAPEELRYIDISSVSPGQIDNITTYAFVDAPGRARRIVQHGDVLWSCVRPNRRSHAQVMHPERDTIASTGFAVLTATKVPFTFLYFATTTDDFVTYLTNNATGAAYPAVTASTFEKANLLVPSAALLKNFGDATIPMAEEIHTLQREIQNLRRTRDLLLPRLLSGQIDLGRSEEDGLAQRVAVLAPVQVPLRSSTSTKAEVTARETSIEPGDSRRPIGPVEREEVLCTIRKVFGDGVERNRDVALRDIAYALGYQRLGPRIREALSADFMAALRRGVVINAGGNYRLGFRSFADCPRDALKDAFESAIGRAWIVREDAIRAFARWAGFGRVGDVIDQIARSLINGLIREGRVETDGPELIRRT
jgi:type I restriction enzyme S subunit